MNKQHLIADPATRNSRREQNRKKVLRFLKDEIYTSRDVIEKLLCMKAGGAKNVLSGLAADGLIKHAQIEVPGGHKPHIWGITQDGQGMAFDPDSESLNDKYFTPERVGIAVLRHTICLQMARIDAEMAGWSGWINGDRAAKWEKNQGRPDAILFDSQGQQVALEMELTFKTKRRYESVILDRLRQIKSGIFNRVVWCAETPEKAVRLRAIIHSIETFTREVEGRKIEITVTDAHRQLLQFSCINKWPQTI